MAAQQGGALPVMKPHDLPNLEPLVASLLAGAPRWNFMQWGRRLEVRQPASPGLGTRDSLEYESVRFRPRPRLGFPAGEIASVEFDEEQPDAAPTVRTTFMGLYGVDAAMPSHMIDDIVLRREGHEAVEAFLDQFNHRLVTLLYRAWKKYRYPIAFRPGGTDAHSRNLLCLAGFGWGDKPARAGLPDSRMLALLGLLIQRTRTPEGLAGVVALAVPGVEVRIDEFYPMLKRAGKPQPLTSTAKSDDARQERRRNGLGRAYVLGSRLAYRGRAARVTLRPANAAQSHDLAYAPDHVLQELSLHMLCSLCLVARPYTRSTSHKTNRKCVLGIHVPNSTRIFGWLSCTVPVFEIFEF